MEMINLLSENMVFVMIGSNGAKHNKYFILKNLR